MEFCLSKSNFSRETAVQKIVVSDVSNRRTKNSFSPAGEKNIYKILQKKNIKT